MKVADYKGYEIRFFDHTGDFQIEGVLGFFQKYKDATAKIDRVIKAEVKENFPIDVVSSSMKVGKITSYNKVEQQTWFSPLEGNRTKDRITDYSGKPRFYKANEINLKLAGRYKEISITIGQLSNEQRKLEKELTEPITFNVNEA